VGKSIVGIQVEAIDLLVQFIHSDPRLHSKKTYALVEGTADAAFLHYTAFKNPFEKAVLITRFLSKNDLIEKAFYNPEKAFYVVPGSLPYYQLSDLLKFHPKDSYIVVQEPSHHLLDNAINNIAAFLNSQD